MEADAFTAHEGAGSAYRHASRPLPIEMDFPLAFLLIVGNIRDT
jgi:hypothetical protein